MGAKERVYYFNRQKVKAPTFCKQDNRLEESECNSIREQYRYITV